jgi:hypothetical protein
MHADMASMAACLPAMQSTQVAALVAAVAFEALPAAQMSHVVAETTLLNLPVGQSAQAACAICAWNVPLVHASQDAAVSCGLVPALARPAGQSWQSVPSLYLPASQSETKEEHLSNPATLASLPAGHALHVDRPVVSAYLPLVALAILMLWLGQSLQALAEERAVPEEALPLAHAVHAELVDAPVFVE